MRCRVICYLIPPPLPPWANHRPPSIPGLTSTCGLFKVCIELSGDVNARFAFAAVGKVTCNISLMIQNPAPRGTTIKHLNNRYLVLTLSSIDKRKAKQLSL